MLISMCLYRLMQPRSFAWCFTYIPVRFSSLVQTSSTQHKQSIYCPDSVSLDSNSLMNSKSEAGYKNSNHTSRGTSGALGVR